MSVWLVLLIIAVTVVVMELVAWAGHKYILHTWGWGWHRTHHEPHDNKVEKNDLIGVIFAVLSLSLVMVGGEHRNVYYWIGVGLMVYGALYFVVHDVLAHKRWPIWWLPRNSYLKRLIQAHRLHHAADAEGGGISYGFLYAPPVATLLAKVKAAKKRDKASGPPDQRAS